MPRRRRHHYNGKTAVAQATDVTVPAGSRVTIEVSGMDWKLTHLLLNTAP